MNKLIYILFLSIFLLGYLFSGLGLLGRYISWFPDFISMLTILIVSGRFMLVGVKNVPPKCFVFLGLFLLNIVIGVIINHVSAGPLIAGFRKYLKFIPFFILPFVYHFSSQQIKQQLKLLLFIFLIQAPVALYQRLVKSKGITSGDYVVGTLSGSGQLTVILSCAIAVLICFYLAKRVDLTSFVVMFILLFIPMTINETKSTLILFPIALILPLYFYPNGFKLKQLIPMLILGVAAGIAFVFIYDYFMRPRWGYGIIDFLTMEGRAENYLYKDQESTIYIGHIGKIDSFVIAFKTLFENILNLFFGFGIGNVSESFIPGLSGEYAEKYAMFKVDQTALSLILWELGVFGAILYYSLYFMVFKDSRRLSTQDSFIGTFSQGFSVVIVILMVATAYTSVFMSNVTAYLFWYFSGYILSEKYRLGLTH